MSKFVKDMITKDLRNRLEGVDDALLVDVIGLKNDKCVALRQRLRKKNIHLLVIKNSLAARATQGTRLEKAFENSVKAIEARNSATSAQPQKFLTRV